MRCGVFDSGIGGLTVAKELISSVDGLEVSYFADFFHLPYGPRPLEEVRGFVVNIIDFLFSTRLDMVVMGCNMSVASGAHKIWQAKSDKPIFEIITPACDAAVKVSKNRIIGVINTEGTYRSNIYQNTLASVGAEKSVVVPCPDFVPLIEANVRDEDAIRRAVKEYLASVKSAKADTLIYGCTHYPFLAQEIREELGENVTLINPAVTILDDVKAFCAQNTSKTTQAASIEHKFYCTGNPENLIKFAPFLGQKIEHVEIVKELE